jgi:UDP-N-acetylglucosamine transferase subunit ALG13
MIFITVGTTPFPFFRMDEVVQSLIATRKNKEKIIYQYGVTTHVKQAANVFLYTILPYPIIQRYIHQARMVISHGGPATIFQVLAAGKTPYVIPREIRYGEHVNNHQVFFCNFLYKRRLLLRNSTMSTMLQNTEAIRTNSRILSQIKPELINFLIDVSATH